MSIYDNSGSSYSQAVKDRLRRISGSQADNWASGDYSFTAKIHALTDVLGSPGVLL